MVQVEVSESHDVRLCQGDLENGQLLERSQAGIDQERETAVADHVPGGPPAGMRYGGP
jgi:hypothetical protein